MKPLSQVIPRSKVIPHVDTLSVEKKAEQAAAQAKHDNARKKGGVGPKWNGPPRAA
jgi:hypothetical protein